MVARKSLPHLLQGHFSYVKNSIKQRYKKDLQKLKTNDTWYKTVISESDESFSYLYKKDFVCSDLHVIVDYVRDTITLTQLRELKEKYGELHYYYIAMEFVIKPMYQRAYDKAINELEEIETSVSI